MHFTRQNQDALLQAAIAPTRSIGWKQDAIAYAALDGSDGPLKIIAVFQDFVGQEAEMHIAVISGARPTPEFVKAMMTLAFHPRALNLSRVWTQTHVDDGPAQVAALKVGFKFEYRKRGGFSDGKDAIVLSMMRAGPHQASAGQTQTDHVAEVSHGR